MNKKHLLAVGISFACASAQANLLISEVLYDAPNNDNTEEFVELFNAGCSAIDLSGYTLNDNGSSIPLSGTVAPASYFTIAKDASAFQSLFSTSPSATGMSLGLGNSGDTLTLKNGSSSVDMVSWENHTSGWSVSASNKSIYRSSNTDTNSNADWSASSATGTPGTGSLSASCDGDSDTSLQNGVAKTAISATQGSAAKYSISVPSGASNLNIVMSGGTGDADLYVRHGAEPTSSANDCAPYKGGNEESCSFASPNAGTYFINLDAYESFSGVSLVASYETSGTGSSQALTKAQSVSNLSGAAASTQLFTLEVPAGASNLTFNLSGGSGDADVYVKYGATASKTSYDVKSEASGNAESVSIAAPQAGTYHLALVGYTSFSGAALVADYTGSTSGGGNYDFNTYYANAIGKTGTELKSALNGIIRGHVQLTYSQVWDALGSTDEDPNNTDNVILLYSGRSVAKPYRAGQTNDLDAWNREHVWAKSHGFPSSGQHGYTDIHHLRPADVSVNSSRGNKDFDVGGSEIGEAPGNFTDSDSFEPMDSVKGDVARMMFYMTVRYEGNDDSGTPDLELVNYTTSNGSPTFGKVCQLLAWHNADPVSSWEVRRNDRAYAIQENRNPFIDNPDWANTLFSSQCN